MNKIKTRLTLAFALMLCTLPTSAPADERFLVEMPAPMQEHMLGNMRDHLHALDDILSALSQGDANAAAQIAETRIGMSSLNDHGAAHLAQFMPEGMQAMGTELHHAASRFTQVVMDADVKQTFEAQKELFSALQSITNTCNACHDAYRIR